MGWNVDLVHSYKTIKPKQFQPFDNKKYNADYVVFTSPSTAINFIEMYEDRVPHAIAFEEWGEENNIPIKVNVVTPS